MNLEKIRFYVVEDRPDSVRTILDHAAKVGLKPENKVGVANDLETARNEIESKWQTIDLVFLDLNLPLSKQNPEADKEHGGRLLKFVHNDLNRRGEHALAVIIVSGEVPSRAEQENWVENHRPTAVGFVMKNDSQPESFQRCIEKYSQDPLSMWIRQIWPEVQQEYDDLNNPAKDANSRSLAALNLAVQLMKNIDEYECQTGTPKRRPSTSSDLNALIKDYLQRNFRAPHHCRLDLLVGPANKWLLRGYLVEHIYSVLKYRNGIIHVNDTGPFHDGKKNYGIWNVFSDTIDRLTRGDRVCKLLVLAVKDVLEWYLPWHEKVFMTWKRSSGTGGTK